MVTACPARHVLEDFLAGALPDAAAGPLGAHVETCRACQASLETLTGSARTPRPSSRPPDNSPPPEFLDRLKQHNPLPPAPAAWPTVAGFEILLELGRGGVGIVYKARQLALDRVVALKVLQDSARATREDLDRFNAEARAIGQLNSAGIVQIFEVGTAGRQPYVALEYLDGGNLGRAIAHSPQPPRAAAACVAKLATAIDAAHRLGVIHRDLKPANILLADGTLDRPKIADFGLAKRLDLGSGHTHTGMILGTPSYMAPEQARGDVRAIDRRTDVYGLGTVLYELLTGRPPFLGPTPLDTVVQVARNDPLPPRQVQPTVPRDLETVCLKCLEKDPARRYDNALDLAADLKAFLAGRPIRARPVGPATRALKLARRHPVPAALAATLVAVVAASVAGLSVLYVRAVAARDQTDAERKIAVAEGERADAARTDAEKSAAGTRAINGFFQKHVLAAPRPGGAGPDVTVRAAIRSAEQKLHDEFADQPEIEAAIRETLANTHYTFGDYAAAREQAAQVLSLRRGHLPTPSAEIFTAQNNLALIDLQLGRFPEAEAMLRDTLAGREKLLGPTHAATLASRNSLSGYLLYSGQIADAIELLKQTLALLVENPDTPPTEILAIKSNLGGALNEQERYAEALPLLRDVLKARLALLPPNHPDVLVSRFLLTSVLRNTGHLDEAEAVTAAAATTARSNSGEHSPQALEAEGHRIMNRIVRGKLDEAATAMKAAFAVGPERLPREHPLWQRHLQNVCIVLVDRRRFSMAKPYLDDLLAVRRATLKPDNILLSGTLSLHADCMLADGRAAEAEMELREALAIREKALPPNHWRIASLQSFLGECLTRQEQYAAAEPLLLASHESLRAAKDATPRTIREARQRLAALYTAQGRPDEAAKWKGD